MRLLSCLGLLGFGCLLSGIGSGVSGQQDQVKFPSARDPDTSTKTIVDNLYSSPASVVFAHHLQLPLLAPLRQLLDDKSRTSTIFVPDNEAKIEELNLIDSLFCENGELVRTDIERGRKFKRQVNKEMLQQVYGGTTEQYEKLKMTDEDCRNLAKLIELDQKVVRDARRIRLTFPSTFQHSHQFKMLIRQNEDEYKGIRFNPEVEKFVLAKYSYFTVPAKVDTRDMIPTEKKIVETYLSKPDLLPIGGWESKTRLVLRKDSEGGLQIMYSSPNAPTWYTSVDDRPIESLNGLIYFTRQSVPYPHKLSSNLLWNQLFLTHALLNYTGLLDDFDTRNITVLVPIDSAWSRVLAQMTDKSTIRRMTADAKEKFRLLTDSLVFRHLMEEEKQKEMEKPKRWRIPTDEFRQAEPTYHRPAEVEPAKEVEGFSIQDSSVDSVDSAFDSQQQHQQQQQQLTGRLNKNDVRQLLLSQAFDGVHFSIHYPLLGPRVTALSGVNLPLTLYPEIGKDQFKIGNSRVLFPDVPIHNGVMHIVDDLTIDPALVTQRYGVEADRHF